jgi:glycosyltransferase involved in cell wall biosynthesis
VALRSVALDVTMVRLGRTGPSVYVEQLARALTPLLGDRLVAVASRLATPPTARRTTADRLRTLGRDLWWHQVGVSRAARRAGAALLHMPAGLGPVRPSLPTVVTIHDTIVLRFPHLFRPWHRHYSRVVLPRLARSAAAVITGSEATRADLVERLGVPPDRITVLPYGVDALFTPTAAGSDEARAVRARYQLPSDFVLTVGAVEPRKNLPRVMEAVHRLHGQPATAGITLVHAGPDGWLADDVPREAARFLGYVPAADLRVLYGLARAFVYASLWEGFGLPVLEAMACGCPVVTSDVSALPEVAGGAALLVDPTATEEVAAAIEQVWTDEGLRRDLAARGRTRARAFTWERTARETLAIYERIAG